MLNVVWTQEVIDKLDKIKIQWLIYNLELLCLNCFGFYKVICPADFFIFNGRASSDYVLIYCYLWNIYSNVRDEQIRYIWRAYQAGTL